jgi:hypothetical protein
VSSLVTAALQSAVAGECVFCGGKHLVARLQVHLTDVLFDGIHEILHWAMALQQMSGGGAMAWEMPPSFLGEMAAVTGLRMAPLSSFDAVARALNVPPVQALHVTEPDAPLSPPVPVPAGAGAGEGEGSGPSVTPEQLMAYMRDLASFLGAITSNRAILNVRSHGNRPCVFVTHER